eukprot:1096878-Pleurochrysis_carterae.AAC.1
MRYEANICASNLKPFRSQRARRRHCCQRRGQSEAPGQRGQQVAPKGARGGPRAAYDWPEASSAFQVYIWPLLASFAQNVWTSTITLDLDQIGCE